MNDIVETLVEDYDMTYRQATEAAETIENIIREIYKVIMKAWKYVKEIVHNTITYIETETGMTIEEVMDKC